LGQSALRMLWEIASVRVAVPLFVTACVILSFVSDVMLGHLNIVMDDGLCGGSKEAASGGKLAEPWVRSEGHCFIGCG